MTESAITSRVSATAGTFSVPRPRSRQGSQQGLTSAPTPVRGRSSGSLRRVITTVAALDVMVILLGFVLAWPLRDLATGAPGSSAAGIALSAQFAPLFLAAWLTSLFFFGGYAKRAFGSGVEEFQNVLKASVFAGLACSTTAYLSNAPLSRAFFVFSFLIGGSLLLAERYAVRQWLRRQRTEGALRQRVLAVGPTASIKHLAAVLAREPQLGYEVVACSPTDRTVSAALPAPAVGSATSVDVTCERHGIDTVMVAGGGDVHLREVAWSLEGRDVDLVVVPHLADVSGSRMHMRPVAGLPLLHVEEPQALRAGQWPKRLFDIVGASAILLLLAPAMLVVAALVKLHDRGPVFYRQSRVGLHGESFKVWKFRSMAVDADRIDAELRAQHGYTDGLFKLEHDPRVTRIGGVLRWFSLDELPQLFNVLDGTMSLVGPRPHVPVEVETYDDEARRRLAVRPGMTGLWQVSGRSNLSWSEAVRLDLFYRDNWSLTWDLMIIAKTVKAVLARDGAY
jgi:exopolysaccharide biosynthesis polyprenyl glycosylphosphotransferase